ncbi:MAG: hypothetical protein MZV64_20945 [Ignavibacteriales bacterium]|nr:hypothetical protein [Ignavibacteriales bacterium]
MSVSRCLREPGPAARAGRRGCGRSRTRPACARRAAARPGSSGARRPWARPPGRRCGRG